MLGGAMYRAPKRPGGVCWRRHRARHRHGIRRVLHDQGTNRVLTFADAAVTPEPTPSQLAEIALVSAREAAAARRRRARRRLSIVQTLGSAAGPR